MLFVSRRQRATSVLPFCVVAGLPLVIALLRGNPSPLLWLALVLTAAVVALIVLPPWERLPTDLQLAPPLLYCVAVGVAREAEGGAKSGLTLLLLLPVLWLALYGSRRHILVVLVGATLTLFLPLVVIGDPRYPVQEWNRTLVWVMVAPMVGLLVQDLVIRQRESEAVLEQVVTLSRRLNLDADSREGICTAACALAHADVSYLFEADGAGNLVSTAASSDELPELTIALTEPSGAVLAFRSGERFFVPDALGHPAVSQRLVEITSARSTLYEPVIRGSVPVGVLVLVWRHGQQVLLGPVGQGISLLAAEASVAMARSDRFAAVSELAAHDALTGLANRRAWDAEAAVSIAEHLRADRSLVLALADLDRFKDYNDHYGHQSGDLLLKEAAAAWRSQLRNGDLLARWGGEEFGILLSLPSDQAFAVLDRLRTSTPRGRTCSIGAAVLGPADDLTSLVARADHALYEAKQQGRDRVVLHAGPAPEFASAE